MRDTVERLEARRLLSVTLDPSTGVLSIVGTDSADTIAVSQNGGSIVVKLNGDSSSFDAATVRLISVDAKGGDDIVSIGDPNSVFPISIPSSILGGDGKDSIQGGSGNDTIDGGAGDDTLSGGAGNDWISAGPTGDDIVAGGDGNDTLMGGTGVAEDPPMMPVLIGGAGDDVITAGPTDTFIEGDDGNDSLTGGPGNDAIIGGVGDDTIRGGVGNDQIAGEEGNDLLFGDQGNDTIDGGVGNDTISGGFGDDSITGNDGNDLIDGVAGNDSIDGGTGDDRIVAGPGNSKLVGGLGNDTLVAGDGNSVLDGDVGDDLLIAAAGNSMLIGGPDDDTFVNRVPGAHDTIDGGPGFDRYQENPNDVLMNVEEDYDPLPAMGPTPVEAPPPAQPATGPVADAASGFDFRGLRQLVGIPPTLYQGTAQLRRSGVLAVIGTTGSDQIQLRESNGIVSVLIADKSAGNFPMAAVSTVFVAVGPGDDVVTLRDPATGAGAISKPSYIVGGDGNDTLLGGNGSDTFDESNVEPNGADSISGGLGTDSVGYPYRTAGVLVTLDGMPNSGEPDVGEHATIDGDVEYATGGEGDDTLVGNASGDVLLGGSGNNVITGSGTGVIGADTGNDSFTVTPDGDVLVLGGGGQDSLVDGAGEGRYIGGPSGDTGNQTVFLHHDNTTEVRFEIGEGNPLPHFLTLQNNPAGYTFDSPPPLVAEQTLDIGRNALTVTYSGASPLATLQADLKSGYDGGRWNGTGIVSSSAITNPGYAIGYADVPQPAAAGQAGGAIRLRYTLVGDTNLDGKVDFTDLLMLAQHYGAASAAGWAQGDQNYDGRVDFDDLLALAQNYGQPPAPRPIIPHRRRLHGK